SPRIRRFKKGDSTGRCFLPCRTLEVDLDSHLKAAAEVALADDPPVTRVDDGIRPISIDDGRRNLIHRPDPQRVAVQQIVDLEEGGSGGLSDDEELLEPGVEDRKSV